METKNNKSEQKQIRIYFEKSANGNTEKREIVWAGYNGFVLIVVVLLLAGVVLLLAGVKFF